MIMHNQKGFTLPSMPTVLVATGILGYVTLNQLSNYMEDLKAQHAENMRTEVVQLIDSLQSCYSDKRAWCDFADIQANYGGETGISITNNVISRTTSGINLTLSVNVDNENYAHELARYLPSATFSGNVLTFTVSPPTASHIHLDNIQRYNDDAGFQRNRVDQTLSFNKNNINSVGLLDADKGVFDSYIAENQSLEDIEVTDSLNLGVGSIQATVDNNGLIVDSPNTYFNGNISFNGNINGNGSSISGIDTLNTQNVTADNTIAAQGNINSVTGTDISYSNADINTVNTVNFSGGTFTANTVNTLILESEHLSGNVTSKNATIGQLGFENASGTNWSYGSTNTNSIYANNSQVGNASGSSAVFTGAITGGTFQGGNAAFSTLTASGNFSGGQFYGNNFYTGVSSIADNKALIDSNTTSINSNSSKISANTSKISSNSSKISANTSKISSNSSKISSNTSSINSNSSKISSNKSKISTNSSYIGSNASKISSNSSAITSNTNKINSAINSASSARSELDSLTNKLVNCMDVTQYCYPQDPSVSLSCSGCTASGQRDSFSGTLSAYVSGCRQGCNYSWNLSGLGSCSGGSVSKGGSKTISCSISKSGISKSSVFNDSVSISVSNSHYTGRTASDSETIRWENTTPALDINSETSLDCSNCFDSHENLNYKGKSTAIASASVNYSNKLTGVQFVTTFGSPNNTVLEPNIGSASCTESKSGGLPQLTAYVSDGDGSSTGTAICSISFTITVTSDNTSGSAVYTGTLSAKATTSGI